MLRPRRGSAIGGIGSAAIGAIVAGILVILLGALVRAPSETDPRKYAQVRSGNYAHIVWHILDD